jgi:hypothetical protein
MPQAARHQSYHQEPPHERQAYHRPHTSMGATGHWIKTAGILAPLIIGEFVADPEKKWRYVRLASVATALVSEAMWTNKIHQEREAAREREANCRSRD